MLFVFHKARQWSQKVNSRLFNERGWGELSFFTWDSFISAPTVKANGKWRIGSKMSCGGIKKELLILF